MKQCFSFFLLLFIPLLLLTDSAKGQNTIAVDSLSIYLTSIKSSTDTNNIYQAFRWFYKSNEEVLLKDNMMDKINALKNKVDSKDYYDFVLSYFFRLTAINTIPFNEKAIAVGQQWIAQNENSKSKYGYYTWVTMLRNLRIPFRNSGKLNEAVEYYNLAEKRHLAAHDSNAVSIAYNVLSGTYYRMGLIDKAKYYQLKSISYLNDGQNDYNIHQSAVLFGKAGKLNRYAVLGSYYIDEKKPTIAEGYLKEAIQFYHQLDSPMMITDATFIFLQMARCKTLEKSSSSSSYYDTTVKYMGLYKSGPVEYAHFYQEKAADFISKNLLDSALNNINKAIQLKDSFRLGIISYFGELLTGFYKGTILIKKGNPKLAIPLLQNEIKELRTMNSSKPLIEELPLLAEAYSANGNTQLAFNTLREAFLLKIKLVDEQNNARSQNFETEKKMQEKENRIVVLDALNQSSQKTKYYLFGIVGLLALFVIGLAVFYSNKRKSNRELALKNERLAYTIQQLKATQTQLIQSEKMASLGELTAGIAHEIQNPLNFVNNFSEVNTELIEELKEELAKGNTPEAISIADDIKDNEQKINHHGKRADAIVKGMLQHSRASTGKKEPTDINALCDEYLRLSYHGLRAKDKSFNAVMKTDFDNTIGNINIIPQDIGRVILNLLTNAFYAVNEKKQMNVDGYEPTVSVSTERVANKVEIKVSDNGNGIPQKVMDKIFQPFFTTKPTGQGTGLGLSLSYDIVTKGHGGQLKVETKEGEGTTFIIILPQS